MVNITGVFVRRVLLLIACFLALSACSGTDTASVANSAAEASAAVTSAAATSAAPTPAHSTGGQTATTSAAATIAVPKVVGQHLDAATSALTAVGLTKTTPTDGSGQGRAVLNSNNWIVQNQKPAAGTRVTTQQVITLVVVKPSDSSADGSVTSGVIPNVVCKDLQTAQDTLQAAGFYNLGSEDGLGQGRSQLIDRNWVVIKQSVPAGSNRGASTRVVLTSVKFGESTGTSGCPS